MNADELFQVAASVRLPACRKCEVCVWPEEVSGHLQGRQHGLSRKDGREVQQVIHQWPSLLHKGDPLPSINGVISQIPELKLYRNALLCQAHPGQCQHIRRSEHAMKTHFSQVHPGSRGSRGAKCKAHRGQHRQELWKAVNCQRLFVQGRGSQLFEVEVPDEEPVDPPTQPPPASKIEQARQLLVHRMAKIEDHERRVIENGTYNAPSPWLKQTGFAQYLRKLDRDELLQSVATPEAEGEPVCHIIWEAMAEMMRQCQANVDQHAGRFVRKEVMRTEEDQSRFVPLKGYQQAEEIRDKGRHWQQMVMFFVRTQQPHQWKSPKYQFNAHQRDAFGRLIVVAQNEIQERRTDNHDDDNHHEDNNDDENNRHDNGHDDDEHDDHDHDSDEDEGPQMVYLEGLPQACLEFCIALLCGKAHQHEYEHALVCALAVLGVDERGWKGFDTYPPILSSVIKIGRMMVIQFGFHESRGINEPGEQNEQGREEDVEDGEDEEDISASGYARMESEGERRGMEEDRKEKPGCIDIVTRMVDGYMLRKSHGPMEWMLDMRTYGMKTMFSSTAP